MLITAWVITLAIVPFVLLVAVREWRLPWALPFVLMSVFAIVELWEAQQWYQAAGGWRDAYQRCIGQCRQEFQSSLTPIQLGSACAFVCDGAPRVLPHASLSFLFEERQESSQSAIEASHTLLDQTAPEPRNHKAPAAPQALDFRPHLAGLSVQPDSKPPTLRHGSLARTDFSLFDLQRLGQSDPTPVIAGF